MKRRRQFYILRSFVTLANVWRRWGEGGYACQNTAGRSGESPCTRGSTTSYFTRYDFQPQHVHRQCIAPLSAEKASLEGDAPQLAPQVANCTPQALKGGACKATSLQLAGDSVGSLRSLNMAMSGDWETTAGQAAIAFVKADQMLRGSGFVTLTALSMATSRVMAAMKLRQWCGGTTFAGRSIAKSTRPLGRMLAQS